MEMIKTSHIVFIFLIISTSYQFKDDQLCSNCTNSHHVYYTDDTAVKYINGNITLANDLNLDIYNVMFYHLKHGRFKPLSIPIELNCKHHRLFIIIILCSGDISLNPGPIKYPCGKCYKPVVGRTNVVVESVIIFCQSRKTRIFTFFISLEKHLKFIIS